MNKNVIGVDEVGRGCIAGPIVCASFACNTSKLIHICKNAKQKYQTETNLRNKIYYKRLAMLTYYDVKVATGDAKITKKINTKKITKLDLDILKLVYDSKKVTQKNRIKIVNYLINKNRFGLGVVSSDIIDKRGIQYANKLAMLKSINNSLSKKNSNTVFTDHLNPTVGISYQLLTTFNLITIDKMDSKSYVTACASIIAKVYRDFLMKEYSNLYPKYNFKSHVGYGTQKHFNEINKYGICKIHRKSFLKSHNFNLWQKHI